MQISITGATGFIGKRLVRHYEGIGATVHILSRKEFPPGHAKTRFFRLDLAACNSSDLIDFVAGSDIIYHCAAELTDRSQMQAVNLEGTKKLFNAARDCAGRWVQLSSVGVYGTPKQGEIDETWRVKPQNEYEQSKSEADRWLTEQSQNSAIELVILRPSTVFAADMPNRSLFQLFSAIQKGRFCFIGTKHAQMNYVHADNVLKALTLCGHHPDATGGIFIVSEHLDIGGFVGIVSDQLQCRPPQIVIPELIARSIAALFAGVRNFPLTSSRVDALTNQCVFVEQHIRQRLGYAPVIPLEKGLRDLVDYFASPDFQRS